MNALSRDLSKLFLALLQTQYGVRQDEGDGADRGNISRGGLSMDMVGVHKGLYRPAILLSQQTRWLSHIDSTWLKNPNEVSAFDMLWRKIGVT